MRKNLHVLLAFAWAFACLMAQSAYAAVPGQTGTIQYEGKKVQINIGEIGKDDKGNTTVEILSDFEVAVQVPETDMIVGALTKVIRVKILARNKTFEASTLSIKKGGIELTISATGMLAKVNTIVYVFDTAVFPEKIMVYNEQDSSLAFDGKTKKIIKTEKQGKSSIKKGKNE